MSRKPLYVGKKKPRNATAIYIENPMYNRWKEFGGKEGDWYLGLNKEWVDFRADLDGLMDLTWKDMLQTRCMKAKLIQKYPVEFVKGYKTQVYVVPIKDIK